MVRRSSAGAFGPDTVNLLQAFAAQSAIAIQNAHLFREMNEKSHQLEVASKHKSQFLANMSHELRTPLNSVLGFAEMLADGLYGELPEKAKVTLGRIQSNGKHLLGLINDVLDLSKIEAGQLTLAMEDYSIGQIVKAVVATTEPLARNKGLKLTATVADGLPLGRGDERRISQVLLNLAGNAVKFTDHGSIDITAIVREGGFEILVRDTGPGIAPEHQQRIFEEFQQIDGSSTRQKGGTGLGLAISKRIVELHGGRIETRFTRRRGIDVPGEAPDPGGERGRRGMSKTILMVEDTEDNRQILRDLFESTDYQLIEAVDGEAGIVMASAHKPDLILMDIQLPVLDGYETTRRLKSNPLTRHIPIIAVTSYALADDEAKVRAAGCDAYITKPFSPRLLLAKVREFLD